MSHKECLSPLNPPEISTIYHLTMDQEERSQFMKNVLRGNDLIHRAQFSPIISAKYISPAGILRIVHDPFPLDDPFCSTFFHIMNEQIGTSIISIVDWFLLQDADGKTEIQIRQLQEQDRDIDSVIRRGVHVKSSRHSHFTLGILLSDLKRREVITDESNVTISYLEAVPYTDPTIKFFAHNDRPSNHQMMYDQHFKRQELDYPETGLHRAPYSNFSTNDPEDLRRYELLNPSQKAEIALRERAVLIPRYRQRFGKYPYYVPEPSPPMGTIWKHYLQEGMINFTNRGTSFPAQLMTSAIKELEFDSENLRHN